MKLSEKSQIVISRLEIFIAIVMFFVMLISCGLYINIKLNGKVSNLPSLSENDTKMLLRSSMSDDTSYSDDLLEPVFVGIKSDDVMMAALPAHDSRISAEQMLNDAVSMLFSGTSKRIEFESGDDLESYIERKKYSGNYMLIGFYSDLPSSVVLPCMLDNYKIDDSQDVFLFKYIFLLPDKDGNLYGCSVSDDYVVTELFPKENVRYDKILNESYDINEGWSRFEFSETELLYPVLISSFKAADCTIDSYAELYGKAANEKWINNLFDVFSINSNLVRSFTSGDNSEINYVEESGELIVNYNGNVDFKAVDSGGISLEEYLGYISDSDSDISFSDKIFALKKIISRIQETDDEISYSLIGINYDEINDSLKFYFKYVKNGIFVYDAPYDAVFELRGDMLVHAQFKAVKCRDVDSFSTVLPQKYAYSASAFDGTKNVYLVFLEKSGSDIKTATWANSPIISEEVE